MAQIDKLKRRLDIADESQDAKLQDILDDIETEMLYTTNRSVMLPAMLSLQIKIAVIEYNKQGSEGMASDSQGGKSQSWVDGLPQDIKSQLIGFRRLKVSNYATEKS